MKLEGKRILVTGGAGFIGSHICEKLLQENANVIILDNFSTGSWRNISELGGLRVVEGDINKKKIFRKLENERFDIAFHYAAVVGVQRTEENPCLVLDDVQGIRNIGKLALRGKIGKVIFASSSEVYGNTEKMPMDEKDGVVAWNPYSTIKLYGEHFFSSLWKHHKIPTVSLRFFNVYGPRQSGSAYGFVVSRFIEQVRSGETLTIHGDGSQTRDFVYVDDNVRAALAAIDKVEAWGQVINVGSGRETSVAALAELIVGLMSCLLYTSPSPRDLSTSRMPSSA